MSDLLLNDTIPGSPDPNKRRNVKKIREKRLKKKKSTANSLINVTAETSAGCEATFSSSALPIQFTTKSNNRNFFYASPNPDNSENSSVDPEIDIFAPIKLIEDNRGSYVNPIPMKLPQKYVDLTNLNLIPLSQIKFDSSDEEDAVTVTKAEYREEPLSQFEINSQIESLLDKDWNVKSEPLSQVLLETVKEQDNEDVDNLESIEDNKISEIVEDVELPKTHINTTVIEETQYFTPEDQNTGAYPTSAVPANYSSDEESNVTIKELDDMSECEEVEDGINNVCDIHLPENLNISSGNLQITQTLYNSLEICSKLFSQKSEETLVAHPPDEVDKDISNILPETTTQIFDNLYNDDCDFKGFAEHKGVFVNPLHEYVNNLESTVFVKPHSVRRSTRNRSSLSLTRPNNAAEPNHSIIQRVESAIVKLERLSPKEIEKLIKPTPVDIINYSESSTSTLEKSIKNPREICNEIDKRTSASSKFIATEMMGKLMLADMEMESIEIAESTEPQLNNSENNLMGNNFSNSFQTARGSAIRVSEKALTHAQNMYNAITVDDIPVTAAEINTHSDRSEVVESPASISYKLQEKKFDIIDEIPIISATSFSNSFQTARGSSIRVSEKALTYAQNMYNAITVEDIPVETNTHVPAKAVASSTSSSEFSQEMKFTVEKVEDIPKGAFVGFSTGRGAAVKISSEALSRANKIFNEVTKETECTNFVGFSTARGGAVSISEDALSKAMQAYKAMEMEDELNATPTLNQNVNIAVPKDNKLVQNRTKHHHDDLQKKPNEQSSLNLVSFSASNAGPKNSSTPFLKRGRRVLDDLDLEQNNRGTPNKVARYQSMSRSDYTPEIRLPKRAHSLRRSFATSTPVSKELQNEQGYISNSNSLLLHDGDDDVFDDVDEITRLSTKNEETTTESPLPQRNRKMRKTKLLARLDDAEGDEHFANDSLNEITFHVEESIKAARLQSLAEQRAAALDKPVKLSQPRSGLLFQVKQGDGIRYSLPEYMKMQQLPPSTGNFVPESDRQMTTESALNHKFNMIHFYSENVCLTNVAGIEMADSMLLIMDEQCCCGVVEIKSAFNNAPGVDVDLMPPGWFENCYKMVVLKLSTMERYCHRRCFDGQILTPENVLLHIKYRYDREIDRVHRPALRKILEKDDTAAKRLVLRVTNIYRKLIEFELELSDGWYCVRTELDAQLQECVRNKKITIGTKLITCGAEMVNLNEGCSPLEISENVRLKIHANSTRRAKSDTKLGFYKVPTNFHIHLDTVLENGGNIGKLIVCIVRVYPMLYMEKSKENGSTNFTTVLRSEKYEKRHSHQRESNCNQNVEQIYEQVVREMEQQEDKQRREMNCTLSNVKVSEISCPIELSNLLEYGNDPEHIQSQMSNSQKEMVLQYQSTKQQSKQEEIANRIRAKLKTENTQRSITPLLKLRIIDAKFPRHTSVLSIWNPQPDIQDMLRKERIVVAIENSLQSGRRNREIQLTAGKFTTFCQLDNLPNFDVDDSCFRQYTPIAKMSQRNVCHDHNECDTLGLVVHIGESDARGFQPVYVADRNKQLLRINFWRSIAEFAYEDVVREKAILAICNLQIRTPHQREGHAIPQMFVTEMTTFSESTKWDHLKKYLERFKELLMKITNLDEYCKMCVHKIKKFEASNQRNNLNTPRNQSNQSLIPCTPDLMTSPRPSTQERIERLKMYGSPPKLSPIVFKNSANVNRGFKPPIQ